MSVGSTIGTIAVGCGLWAGWHHLLDGQASMCEAESKFLAEQLPYAFQIEKSRHPITVGAGLEFFDRDGVLLRNFQESIRTTTSEDGTFKCALQTAVMHLMPDEVRAKEADELEKTFGIAGLP